MPRELKADMIFRTINELYKELFRHQHNCKHPRKQSGLGCDSFHKRACIHHYCPTCRKQWVTYDIQDLCD